VQADVAAHGSNAFHTFWAPSAAAGPVDDTQNSDNQTEKRNNKKDLKSDKKSFEQFRLPFISK
jgi:hypothetical protein